MVFLSGTFIQWNFLDFPERMQRKFFQMHPEKNCTGFSISRVQRTMFRDMKTVLSFELRSEEADWMNCIQFAFLFPFSENGKVQEMNFGEKKYSKRTATAIQYEQDKSLSLHCG